MEIDNIQNVQVKVFLPIFTQHAWKTLLAKTMCAVTNYDLSRETAVEFPFESFYTLA